MLLQESLCETHQYATPEQWGVVRSNLPQGWIEQALLATGVSTLRRRRLPMEQAVWLVLGIALLRDRSILHVADALEVALPAQAGGAISSSALSQARQRLGSEPLEWLFRRTAEQWAHQEAGRHRWHGLSVYALDGVVWRAPDTPSNRQRYGGQGNQVEHQNSFPLVRMVCLLDARARLLVDARLDAYDASEYTLAQQLWPQLPEDSLVIVDKGFYSAGLLWPLQHQQGRHWLIPARAGLRGDVVCTHGPGDVCLRMKVSPQARKRAPNLPLTWEVRAVTRQIDGKPRTLFTSLADPLRWAADDVFALYHERWEIELAYGEIKTDMLRQAMTLRSQHPNGVEQELWATLLMYNLIRLEMTRIADEAKVEPSRISFVTALRYIIDEWLWSSTSRTPGAIPSKLRTMRQSICRFVLPPRRSQRRYPRAARINKSQYPIKKNAAQA
ncbi:putative transposase, IS4 family [Ralstonia solanacearum CMR15]|nr:putative transposase, IS4 family [Ralstonia solanacearum CMR15]CBJ38160.1 putative transposase, IS4 family [Ralstonia solanacearum CMR15]CBJ38870.1 putative transposase, IS4 family [Ralstonia solanacearum CMR15]